MDVKKKYLFIDSTGNGISRDPRQMQFFNESTLNESLLRRLGMEDVESRNHLLGYFESVLCFSRSDIISAFSDFVGCLARTAADIEGARADNRDLHARVDWLQAASLSASSDMDALRSDVRLLEARASELTTINAQMKAAIEAYKEKCAKYKVQAVGKDTSISALRSEMESYDARLSKCLADASTADALSSARMKELEIQRERSLHRQRFLVGRATFFQREMRNAKRHWTVWSGRSASLPGRRCGCGQSVRYFERSGIDLEWVTEQVTRASAGFRAELEAAAERMRAELHAMRDERDGALADGSVYIGRALLSEEECDDALADCSVYIDRLLRAEEELRRSNLRNSDLLTELSVATAEFARRGGADRAFLRAQLFSGGGGRGALVCPVPTVDGGLVSLVEVYRGWMSTKCPGGGAACGTGFLDPVSGESLLLCCKQSAVLQCEHLCLHVFTFISNSECGSA